MKTAFAFTLDASFALLVVVAALPALVIVSIQPMPSQLTGQQLHFEAEDAVDVLAKTRVIDVESEPVVAQMLADGTLSPEDLNRTLLDILGSFWATGDAGNLSAARNLTRELLTPFFPPAVNWSFSVSNDTIYNTSGLQNAVAASTSKRAASGFSKNQPSTGFIARAFLENVVGNQLSSYFFFGGFVGQGNATATITGVPADANVTEIYLELNGGEDFGFYVNGIFCRQMSVTPGNFTVDNWTITDAFCLNNVAKGMQNNFTLNFSAGNLTNEFIGGGYLRVTYSTAELLQDDGGLFYYRFPGVHGLINLYDSIYVPGNITAMNANVTFFTDTNYSTQLLIGNTTIINHTGINQTVTVNVNDSSFQQYFADNGITYVNLSDATTPLRMFVEANITGGLLNGTVDIVLITDTSGSMAWRLDQDGVSGNAISNCSDPAIEQPATSRISLAKCLDKDFINAILGGNASECTGGQPIPGNRVALVDFAASVKNWTSLTEDIGYLEGVVNAYSAAGGTCVSCAINRAYEILASQSDTNRSRYIVVMTDGVANYRSTPICYDFNDAALDLVVGEGGATAARAATWLAANGGGAADNFNGVSAYNSTLARAVADGGEIYAWNGAAWILETDTGTVNVYGVDLWNETLGFAAGASAKIWRWNGLSWSQVNDFGSFSFWGVAFVNGSWAFAVGDGGVIYRWNGASWALFQDVGSANLYAVDAVSGPLAYAVGSGGKIYRWTGGTFSEVQDTGSNAHYDVSILNSSRVFTASSNGRVYEWNGASWTNTALSNNALVGVYAANSSLAYAAGIGQENGDIYEWNGASWRRTNSTFYYEGNATAGIYCYDDDSCSLAIWQSYPAMNANYSTARAFANLVNLTVDSVGFGPIATCQLGNDTVTEIAKAGNGSSYSSSNATELRDIYCQIANDIITKTTPTQQVVSQGNLSASILYPESYIEFKYTPAIPPAGYQEITLNAETERFAGCEGSFFITPGITVTNALRTSYSSYYWTKNVFLQNSLTGGGFQNVYNLSLYGALYGTLGDPYQVYLPVSLLASNETNVARNELGLNASYSTENCSSSDRVIYTARLRGYAPYGGVFEEQEGRNVTVYYDSNHDGAEDGFVYVAYGTDLPDFDPTPVNVSSLVLDPDTGCNNATSALDDAFIRLLKQVNYIIIPPDNPYCPGEGVNPIDIVISPNVRVETDSIAFVPFVWGPVDMSVSVWV